MPFKAKERKGGKEGRLMRRSRRLAQARASRHRGGSLAPLQTTAVLSGLAPGLPWKLVALVHRQVIDGL